MTKPYKASNGRTMMRSANGRSRNTTAVAYDALGNRLNTTDANTLTGTGGHTTTVGIPRPSLMTG